MKKSIFLLTMILAYGITKAQENKTITAPLDILITQFSEAVKEQNIAKAKACFSATVESNLFSDSVETCTRSEFFGGIKSDELWKDLTLIEAACNGFAIRDDGKTFENMHSDFRNQNGSILVQAEGLALRRGPGTSEEVIVRLHEGAYVGHKCINALAMQDPKNGYTWVPIQIKLVGLGMVSGYVAMEYIELHSAEQAYQIMVAETALGLRITEIHQKEVTLSSLPSASL